MDRLQRHQHRHRHEELTGGVRRGGGAAMEASRRGRFDHHHDAQDQQRGGAGVPVVDQAECTAQTCRSCVAVTLADAIALGCCPCAVVSLLGLAFVKAPLAVARRCLRRLRRRRGELRHKKRVRDMGGPAATRGKRGALEATPQQDANAAASKCARGSGVGEARASSSSSGRLDAEKVWMEMYRVGHWGFGRLSISTTPPPPATATPGGRCPDGDGGRRKDVDLRCES